MSKVAVVFYSGSGNTEALGNEVLEETIFRPMWDDVKTGLEGKMIALYGFYGWGDGQRICDWEADTHANGVTLTCESVICKESPDGEADTALAKAIS